MKEEINIDDFSKVELRVGKILSGEKIPDTNKLLKFTVDLKEREIQIVSGIAEYYDPENLIGWKVIIVNNLKPVELKGELSEGMLLCAKEKEKITLIRLDNNIEVGSLIS